MTIYISPTLSYWARLLIRDCDALCKVNFTVRALAEHLFKGVVSPYIFLNSYRSDGVLPLLEVALIVRSKLNNTVISRKSKAWDTFLDAKQLFLRSSASSRHRHNSTNSGGIATYCCYRGRTQNAEIRESNIHDAHSSHFLEIIQ